MGFFDSVIVQDLIAIFIVGYFLLVWYSVFKKQSTRDTMAQIKEWYNNYGMEEKE